MPAISSGADGRQSEPYPTRRLVAGRPLERPPSEGRTRGNEGACDVTAPFVYVLTRQRVNGYRPTDSLW